MAKQVRYSEPADYFPKSVRKKNKIGEYATTSKTKTTKTSKKK